MSQDLHEQLEQERLRAARIYPGVVIKWMKEGIEQAKASTLHTAKTIGDHAPDFELPNALGETITLRERLKHNKVIIIWYRGSWCPYCNLALRAYQQQLDAYRAAGAELIAISPEKPDGSISLTEKHALQFQVLSDKDNSVARKFGITFTLSKLLTFLYRFGGANLAQANKNTSRELPLSAAYVINRDGIIEYAFLEADYKKRADPVEILQFLNSAI